MDLLSQLHSKYPWRSVSKFHSKAAEHGFSRDQVSKYLATNVVHDKQRIKARKYHLPIYGRYYGVYQFDTLIQSRDAIVPAFLILININSRKAYAYPMMNKGVNEVLKALKQFLNDASVKPVEMTSDQDSSYLSQQVVNFFIEHGIDFRTTEDNNHNILGIINRFIKTLRDLNINNRDFTVQSMNRCIRAYNTTKHSSTNIAPNNFNESDYEEYVARMEQITSDIRAQSGFDLKIGDKVRVILEHPTIGKKRTNLSHDYYLIDSERGNGYLIKAQDGSVDYYPRHKLVKSGTGNFAETLKNDKRGIVKEITAYDSKDQTYSIVYDEGTRDVIKAKNLREAHPTRLGPLEIEYWKRHKNIPESIKLLQRL